LNVPRRLDVIAWNAEEKIGEVRSVSVPANVNVPLNVAFAGDNLPMLNSPPSSACARLYLETLSLRSTAVDLVDAVIVTPS